MLSVKFKRFDFLEDNHIFKFTDVMCKLILIHINNVFRKYVSKVFFSNYIILNILYNNLFLSYILSSVFRGNRNSYCASRSISLLFSISPSFRIRGKYPRNSDCSWKSKRERIAHGFNDKISGYVGIIN